AIWTVPDEAVLIEYLIERLSEAGDGKSFKTSMFNGAAKHMETIRTQGGPKTSKSCFGKYSQLRKFQGYVEVIKGISGWKWNAEKGVDVDAAMASSWDDCVAKNLQAKRFHNKGWPHYKCLLLLMPENSKGTNV
ncbi:hypothetical protein B0H19DRAFT_906246, partial [Mycena capillaripes]